MCVCLKTTATFGTVCDDCTSAFGVWMFGDTVEVHAPVVFRHTVVWHWLQCGHWLDIAEVHVKKSPDAESAHVNEACAWEQNGMEESSPHFGITQSVSDVPVQFLVGMYTVHSDVDVSAFVEHTWWSTHSALPHRQGSEIKVLMVH
jgi:hypothetical protein